PGPGSRSTPAGLRSPPRQGSSPASAGCPDRLPPPKRAALPSALPSGTTFAPPLRFSCTWAATRFLSDNWGEEAECWVFGPEIPSIPNPNPNLDPTPGNQTEVR